MKTFLDYGIDLEGARTGTKKIPCPRCSNTRKKCNEPCLSVNIDDGLWKCHHCDWSGSLDSRKDRDHDGELQGNIEKVYRYEDESGNLLCEVVRFPPKSFRTRRPDGNGGWIWDLKDVRRVPYLLPELINSTGPVYIAGGEKDVETLRKHDLTATTNLGGEGNWKREFNEYLKDRDVVILEDNDEKGQKHGRVVSECLHGVAKQIKIIRFSELQRNGDVTDFLSRHSLTELMQKVDSASVFQGVYSEYFGESESKLDPKGSSLGPDDQGVTQSQILINLAFDCEFFHDDNGDGFVTFPQGKHRETSRIRSKTFKRWLTGKFYLNLGKPPQAQAMTDALGVFECKAKYEGEVINVAVRIGEKDGNINLDLGNENWEAIEIDRNGWKVLREPPIPFIRPRGMLPLPTPVRGGNLKDLTKFLNLEEKDWPLVAGYLIASMKPTGPYPILILQGEQGSAKSTFARLIRRIIDPNSSPLRTIPRNERDLMIAAQNGWILNFDNLSGLRKELADAFCRLSTGGGFSTRELYSDGEETLFNSQRPLILNGIDDIAVRGDLKDRAFIINLPVISEEKRRPESEVLEEFEQFLPSIIGALLDAVVCALKNLASVQLNSLPRMADTAKWVTAAEESLGWSSGTFMKVYGANRVEANRVGLEFDLVAQAIFNLKVETSWSWEGTYSELLGQLNEKQSDSVTKNKFWPKTASALSQQIRRQAVTLRSAGIEVRTLTRTADKRPVLITKTEQLTVTPVIDVTEGNNPK
ncbi:MAG: hypothetical protein COV66_07560 [Nitrospinae bacterium CG11_big_fil_rev_8_21_14_0_20_45_15]|nr:MAG: hypothetical protein COV66_07560 [Nitrospinae bacterium CG11_big_fil_rev_8_21_14_0_20_45_15]